ncbi:MAG: sporulation protein YqfD [Clostridia bacterium]|nr:sporulation protein YqfD [Clostridia bacterium]
MSVKWLFGYRKLKCDKGFGIRMLNLMMRYNFEYWGLKRGEKGEYEFFLLEKDYKNLLSLLDKYDLKVYSVKGRGLPFICKAHKNRWGLLVGSGIFVVILLLSSLFVWDIRVVSETDIPHNEILANLKALGCYEGSFVPAIDFEDLCIDYVNNYKDCSWISVNLRGTVAYVEIQDKRIFDEENQTPRNLVASHSGIVEKVSVYSGKSHVEDGSVVKKGDLLVSGIVDSKLERTRLCRADAEVCAVVTQSFSEEVEYAAKKQVYTGNICEKSSLRFFNFKIPLNTDQRDSARQYTSLTENNGVLLFDCIELPLSVEKEVFYEYTVEDFTYTQKEAQALAQRRIRKRFEKEFPDAELISVYAQDAFYNNKYVLTYNVKCRLDITMPKEIKTQ